MKQNPITIVCPVIRAGADRLEAILNDLGNRVEKQTEIPFQHLEQLHFAAWVVLRDEEFGPQLVFEGNFDGEPDAFLSDLVKHAEQGLDQIYQFCPGYPMTAPRDIRKYLLDHKDYTDTFYVGCVGVDRNRILCEQTLRDRIEGFLDGLPHGMQDAAEIQRRIQDFVRGQKDLEWALEPPEPLPLWDRLPSWARWAILLGAAAALVALLLVPLLLILPVFVVVLRWKEITDPAKVVSPKPSLLKKLKDREDHRSQNHLTTINDVKPGLFRYAVLKLVLAIVKPLARLIEIKGKLSNIPTIHFARWVVLDRGSRKRFFRHKRLLFLSNFDGSWESYLGEFIDLAAVGLTAIWSNVVNFPKTKFLAFGGARDEQPFKAAARNSQVPSMLWYSAYPYLSVPNILNNAEIRRNLWRTMNSQELQAWLRRF